MARRFVTWYRLEPPSLPIRHWLPGYERRWLRPDVIAAAAVWAVLVPEGIAYASLAGLPPATGLFAALAPLLAYAVFGTCRQLTVGPSSAVAAYSAAAVAQVALGDPTRFIALSALLALLVGALLLVAGPGRHWGDRLRTPRHHAMDGRQPGSCLAERARGPVGADGCGLRLAARPRRAVERARSRVSLGRGGIGISVCGSGQRSRSLATVRRRMAWCYPRANSPPGSCRTRGAWTHVAFVVTVIPSDHGARARRGAAGVHWSGRGGLEHAGHVDQPVPAHRVRHGPGRRARRGPGLRHRQDLPVRGRRRPLRAIRRHPPGSPWHPRCSCRQLPRQVVAPRRAPGREPGAIPLRSRATRSDDGRADPRFHGHRRSERPGRDRRCP